ncbi:MAG: phosphate regulon sensor histidine kinase PhoR [Pseudomonadales bacterium]|jgi:two-component system phosphate regulon sensor histidine kinase PhoR|nr:phosphate regulon sensor histidine kinase PhoR [Pseudomonadales bacterium]
MRAWAAEALTAGGLTAAGALAGGLAGVPSTGALAGLALYTVLRLRALAAFERWLEHSLGRPPPLAGAFSLLAHRIWRRRRSARERTRRLARLLRQLQAATNALPDAAVLLDGQDQIVWFNEAGATLLGLQPRDTGRSLTSLLRAPELLALLNDPDHEGTEEMLAPGNERVTLDVRLIPYTEDRRLLLARDVSQIVRLRTMRQDFIANVSHELRTPLTVVLGYLESLAGEDDAAVLQATLERLRRPAARMKSLVEDLLLLSRLDTGAPPEPESVQPVDVAGMLRRMCADASAIGDERHRFELELDDGLLLLGVERELHSAFGNLIVNAVRYSPDGGTIHVRWRAEAGGARYAVQDEGIGIAEEHIPRLTERFYRVDVGRSREAGGTGLGLAIVKHVLRRHESELEVSSTLGRGSTFSCRFPASRLVPASEAHRHENVTVS